MISRLYSARWLILAWALFIFCVSSIPGRQFPDVSLLQHDKALHALLYAPLGALLLLALRRTSKIHAGLLILIAATLTGLYGITDEFHQKFVPGRSPDSHDVIADLVGGTLGACAAWMVTRFVRSSPRNGKAE